MAEVHFSANVPADLPLVAELQPKPPPAPV
jgi:hypothetical protein